MKVAAEGIATGDLKQDVEVTSSDEIGAMATTFGDMIECPQGMAGAASAITEGDLAVTRSRSPSGTCSATPSRR